MKPLEARARGEPPLPAIGRDRTIDQARIARRHRRIIETILLHHASGEIFHHDVGLRDQFARDLARFRLGKIECDAVLAAVEADIRRALAGEISVLISARIVAAIGVLDLDYLGAELGQRLRAGRTRDDPGAIHDQETVDRGRRVVRARRAIR